MKLTISILLIAILAFNWVGYRFVSQYLANKADADIEARIDNLSYLESDLIEFRISLESTPYYSGPREFESISGEVELEGIHYNYVKRKIESGQLVLLCLRNHKKTLAENSRLNFFRLVNDLDRSSGKDKNATYLFKTFTTEYWQQNNHWWIEPCVFNKTIHFSADKNNLSVGFLTVFSQPPRLTSSFIFQV